MTTTDKKNILVTDIPITDLFLVANEATRMGRPLTYRIRQLIAKEARRIEARELRQAEKQEA